MIDLTQEENGPDACDAALFGKSLNGGTKKAASSTKKRKKSVAVRVTIDLAADAPCAEAAILTAKPESACSQDLGSHKPAVAKPAAKRQKSSPLQTPKVVPKSMIKSTANCRTPDKDALYSEGEDSQVQESDGEDSDITGCTGRVPSLGASKNPQRTPKASAKKVPAAEEKATSSTPISQLAPKPTSKVVSLVEMKAATLRSVPHVATQGVLKELPLVEKKAPSSNPLQPHKAEQANAGPRMIAASEDNLDLSWMPSLSPPARPVSSQTQTRQTKALETEPKDMSRLAVPPCEPLQPASVSRPSLGAALLPTASRPLGKSIPGNAPERPFDPRNHVLRSDAATSTPPIRPGLNISNQQKLGGQATPAVPASPNQTRKEPLATSRQPGYSPPEPFANDLSWFPEPDFLELDQLILAHQASKETFRKEEAERQRIAELRQEQSYDGEDAGMSGRRGQALGCESGGGRKEIADSGDEQLEQECRRNLGEVGISRGPRLGRNLAGTGTESSGVDRAWLEKRTGQNCLGKGARELSSQRQGDSGAQQLDREVGAEQGSGSRERPSHGQGVSWGQQLDRGVGAEQAPGLQNGRGVQPSQRPLDGCPGGAFKEDKRWGPESGAKGWPPKAEENTPERGPLRKKEGVSLRKKRRVIESDSDCEDVKPSLLSQKNLPKSEKKGSTGSVGAQKAKVPVSKRTVETCVLDNDSDDDVVRKFGSEKKARGKEMESPVASLKERVLRTVGKGSGRKAKRKVKVEGGSVEDLVEEALERLSRKVADEGQIVHVESQPAQPAVHKESQWPLQKKIAEALAARGVTQLYSHQAEAISHVFGGSSLVAATPTASGKSLTYCIPVLDAILSIPKARALLVFPTKALARDQLKAMRELIAVVKPGIACEQFDGDTPFEERKQICRKAQIIFTNPDMIHQTILQRHTYWKAFFSNLAFCVIDEAHHYKGAFGSHVGLVLRRLLRVAQHYGVTPQFICCSATINNPVEHVSRLISKHDTQLVKGSGAPLGPRHIVLWQPALVKDGDGKRKSAYIEAAKVMVEMICAGLQTLVFVGARKLTEIVCNSARDMLKAKDRLDLMEKVESYRAGYSPEERRRLEQSLANGELRALVSTNALELGIDIGQLDCTIHVGLPDTMSSLWQQIGRAGRRQTSSLAVIIGQERPLDQHYMRHPDELFRRGIEDALCDPLNPYLLRMHLPCAANEVPLTEEDEAFFGPEFTRVRDELVEASELRYALGPNGEDQYSYRWEDNPAAKFNIRGAAQDPFKVVDENDRFIEEVEKTTAFRRIHAGAIFLHQRDSYEVLELDVEGRKATVKSCSPEYMTEVKDSTSVKILEAQQSRKALAANLNFGTVKVIETIVGFQKRHIVHDKVIEESTLQLPPTEYDTCAIWWDVPPEAVVRLEGESSLMDALAGVKRMVISLLPQMSMMDRHDIGGLAVLKHEGTERPQVFVFDAYPGGIGITKQAFGKIEEVWRQALTMLKECDCSAGCPSCVQPSTFESKDGSMAVKKACRLLLEALLADWMITTETTEQTAAAAAGPSDAHFHRVVVPKEEALAARKVEPLKDATNLKIGGRKGSEKYESSVEKKPRAFLMKRTTRLIIDLEDE